MPPPYGGTALQISAILLRIIWKMIVGLHFVQDMVTS